MSARRAGFTLIEIMIVVSILMVLGGIVFLAGRAVLEGAKVKGCRAQIRTLRMKIEEYHSITGKYPPDGIDFPVKNSDGVAVRGSAALYHALSTPFTYREMAAGIPRMRRHERMMEFGTNDLSPEDPDYPGVHEIWDAFSEALHYDNTEDGRFRPQGGEVHYPPVADKNHPDDPRTLEIDEGGVKEPGKNQSTGYDLWSHGPRAHETGKDRGDSPPIATWNLSEQ